MAFLAHWAGYLLRGYLPLGAGRDFRALPIFVSSLVFVFPKRALLHPFNSFAVLCARYARWHKPLDELETLRKNTQDLRAARYEYDINCATCPTPWLSVHA